MKIIGKLQKYRNAVFVTNSKHEKGYAWYINTISCFSFFNWGWLGAATNVSCLDRLDSVHEIYTV